MVDAPKENLTVAHAPHIGSALSTRKIMLEVVISLAPAMIAAGIYFRLHALVLILTCVISCVLTEWFSNLMRGKLNPFESVGDFSAVVTGIILALSLPPALPFWAAIIGSCFAIGIAKMVFGGLGANIFNPAMVGRAFLTACFGMLMTTWTVPATINSDMPAISAENTVSAVTQATPLAWSKQALKNKAGAPAINEQMTQAFIGQVGGCLGETSTVALLIGAVILLLRKTITVHIPLAVLSSAFAFASIVYLFNPDAYVSPLLHLTSGALIFCAFFIATDPVTAPLTTKGMWLFGAIVGCFTMLIRVVGEYPEGVMYAVLLANGVRPLIDRLCKPIPAGGVPRA